MNQEYACTVVSRSFCFRCLRWKLHGLKGGLGQTPRLAACLVIWKQLAAVSWSAEICAITKWLRVNSAQLVDEFYGHLWGNTLFVPHMTDYTEVVLFCSLNGSQCNEQLAIYFGKFTEWEKEFVTNKRKCLKVFIFCIILLWDWLIY